jgi:hypothetical protein
MERPGRTVAFYFLFLGIGFWAGFWAGRFDGLDEGRRVAVVDATKEAPPPSAWMILAAECETRCLESETSEMFAVLVRESDLDPLAKNKRSTAKGIAQFTDDLWEHARRGSGLPATASPLNTHDAIHALVWQWAQPNGKEHWRKR